jgi:chaperonin GroEL
LAFGVQRLAFGVRLAGAVTQNAASISGLLLTTEALVTELPEKEKPAPADGPGGTGGMDY